MTIYTKIHMGRLSEVVDNPAGSLVRIHKFDTQDDNIFFLVP